MPGDDPLALGGVLHVDGQGAPGTIVVVGHVEAVDVALASGAPRPGLPSAWSDGIAHLVVHRDVGVADTGEHVGDRIGHCHWCSPPHQLALVTPGISPAWASSRRQIRHSPNLRYTDAGPAAALARV